MSLYLRAVPHLRLRKTALPAYAFFGDITHHVGANKPPTRGHTIWVVRASKLERLKPQNGGLTGNRNIAGNFIARINILRYNKAWIVGAVDFTLCEDVGQNTAHSLRILQYLRANLNLC